MTIKSQLHPTRPIKLRTRPWKKGDALNMKKRILFAYWIVDIFIFGKLQRFQNNSSATANFYRVCWITVMLALTYMLLHSAFQYIPCFEKIRLSTTTAAAGILSILGGLYWNFDKQYKSRWKYASDLFNQAEILTWERRKNSHAGDILFRCLSIDLLQMDFWTQKLFAQTFRSGVKAGIESVTENISRWETFLATAPEDTQLDPYIPFEHSRRYLVDITEAGELYVKDAYHILSTSLENLKIEIEDSPNWRDE